MKTEKFGILLIVIIVLMLFALAMAAQAQEVAKFPDESQLSAGTFTISKTVIAGGGAEMQNQSRAVKSTAGQAIAGGTSTGGAFSLKSGFWTPDDSFVPTAASVMVSGRVLTAEGRGIRNVRVTIFFPTGQSQTTLTGAFGNYRFSDVEVGSVYVFTVSSKRFVFSQPTQVLSINGEREDINFIAEETNPREKYEEPFTR
jgi:hypothetical protein